MTSAQTIFLSVIACLFSILALSAAMPSSILWRTLRWELLEDIVLQKNNQKVAKENNTNEILLVPEKFQHYNGSKLDAQKILHMENSSPTT